MGGDRLHPVRALVASRSQLPHEMVQKWKHELPHRGVDAVGRARHREHHHVRSGVRSIDDAGDRATQKTGGADELETPGAETFSVAGDLPTQARLDQIHRSIPRRDAGAPRDQERIDVVRGQDRVQHRVQQRGLVRDQIPSRDEAVRSRREVFDEVAARVLGAVSGIAHREDRNPHGTSGDMSCRGILMIVCSHRESPAFDTELRARVVFKRMGIVGHGVDLVEITRISEMLAEHGDQFRARCFTSGELAYAQLGSRVEAERLAVRFAAKEAILKALGTGLRDGIDWTELEITRDELGAPGVLLHDRALEVAMGRGIDSWAISLSHARSHAIASVIAWSKTP